MDELADLLSHERRLLGLLLSPKWSGRGRGSGRLSSADRCSSTGWPATSTNSSPLEPSPGTAPSPTRRSSATTADVATAGMDLTLARSGYQAVLRATGQLSMPSLVDFLR